MIPRTSISWRVKESRLNSGWLPHWLHDRWQRQYFKVFIDPLFESGAA